MSWMSWLTSLFGGDNKDSGIGMSAVKGATEGAESGSTSYEAPKSTMSKFQDFSDRYSAGKESNLGRFVKDTKEGNYAGSLGYAGKLAETAQGGAKPTPLIQLQQPQQRPVRDRYSDIYRRYRG